MVKLRDEIGEIGKYKIKLKIFQKFCMTSLFFPSS